MLVCAVPEHLCGLMSEDGKVVRCMRCLVRSLVVGVSIMSVTEKCVGERFLCILLVFIYTQRTVCVSLKNTQESLHISTVSHCQQIGGFHWLQTLMAVREVPPNITS